MNNSTPFFARLRVGRVLSCIVLLLLIWRLLPSGQKDLVRDFKKSIETVVQKQFKVLQKTSDSFLAACASSKSPKNVFGDDGSRELDRNIARELAKMKELLLSENCQTLLSAEISVSRKLAKLEELASGKDPDKDKSLFHEKYEVERQLETIHGNIRTELSRIGLDFSGPTKAVDFFKLDTSTLIDCAIVAKAASEMVAKLRPILETSGNSAETMDRTKRYYGMYVSAVAVQTDCFRMYLQKADRGDWSNQLKLLRDKTQFQIDKIRNEGDLTDIAKSNLKRHEARLASIANAQKVLAKHREIIADKLSQSVKLWKDAVVTYEGIKLDCDFSDLVGNIMETFTLVSNLKMPVLEVVDGTMFDTNVVQETARIIESSIGQQPPSKD